MNISSFSIKRPVFATVLNLAIVLFGIVGYTFLAVRDYPAIDPPIINVTTSYAGANSDIIESQITEPLEKVINGIPGIRSISSSSATGRSNINIEFNLGENLEASANDVRDKVGQAIRNLPQDIDAPPVVTKSDANSDFIILVGLQSSTKSLMELSDYAENVLQEKLQTIPEVSAVNILGQKRPSMRIWSDPEKMNLYNITFSDIKNALDKENIEVPSGKIYGKTTELTIKVMGKLLTEDDFNNLILRQSNEGIVRLKDVAKVEIGPENEEFLIDVDFQLIKEKGIDFYLGHILKKVEEEHEERIKANIEKKAEPKPTGNSEMVTFNPGSVRYEDLKAFLEQQNAQRYKQ